VPALDGAWLEAAEPIEDARVALGLDDGRVAALAGVRVVVDDVRTVRLTHGLPRRPLMPSALSARATSPNVGNLNADGRHRSPADGPNRALGELAPAALLLRVPARDRGLRVGARHRAGSGHVIDAVRCQSRRRQTSRVVAA
jgi:hypothetical protein